MRALVLLGLLSALAACSTTSTATFSCPNGPEIAVSYTDDVAVVAFQNGRTESVPSDPARAGVYAKPGFSWSETGFRSGRLSDGTSSYACDQTSG